MDENASKHLEGISEEIPKASDLAEIMQHASPEVRNEIIKESFMAVMMGDSASGNKLADKFNEEHISDYLAGSRENMQLGYKEKDNQRTHFIIVLVIIIVTVFGMIIILKDNPNLLESIIYLLTGIAGGGIGGYGYGFKKGRDANDD